MPRLLLALALTAALTVAGTLSAGAATRRPVGPTIAGCPAFPVTNAWNRDVSRDPVDARSARYVAAIGAGNLHADFGGRGQYGIPFVVVPANQRRVPIAFTAYGSESDRGPSPIPLGAPIEGGRNSDGDRHVIVVQRGTCRLFELYRAFRRGAGWAADSAATHNLRSNRMRPAGWTSADAAGLPIFPGLARYDESRSGVIRHALRFTVSDTQRGYVYPARHFASDSRNPDLPPMGLRLRLKASYPIGAYRGHARVILTALKRYGMIVADNGADWFITGASDRRWPDEDLNQLKRVPGAAFEVVRSGSITRG